MKHVDSFADVRERFERIEDWIRSAATESGIDPILIAAICWQESDFNPFAFRFEPKFMRRYIDPIRRERIVQQNPAVLTGVPTEETERYALATSFGPMQIMGQTARERGFDGQFLTELNGPQGVLYGARQLKRLFDRANGDLTETISNYNDGSSRLTANHKTYVPEVKARIEALNREWGRLWLETI